MFVLKVYFQFNTISQKDPLQKLPKFESVDEEEEIEFTREVREKFCKQFNKKNNRQFKLIRVNY